MHKNTGNLSYDPETGIVTRSGSAIAHLNRVVGLVDTLGYLRTTYEGKKVRVHRLAWFLYYGVWPNGELDHINGNKLDNRIANLREATRSMQTQNKRYPVGPSGYRGVRFHAKTKKWHARIANNGKTFSLGLYDTPREAFIVYALEALELYGEHARLT